jgi:hypothetical protein
MDRDGALFLREVGSAFPLRKGRVDVVSVTTSVVVVHRAQRGGREETGCSGRLEVAPRKGCCQPLARAGFCLRVESGHHVSHFNADELRGTVAHLAPHLRVGDLDRDGVFCT